MSRSRFHKKNQSIHFLQPLLAPYVSEVRNASS